MAIPDSIKIRVARRGDRDSIYRLLGEVGVTVPAHDQSNTLSWIVSHPETEVLIAVDPLDRGVGMVALSHRPALRLGGRLGTIDSLVVSVSMRKKGIGTELLERAMSRARMLGCKQIEMANYDEPSRTYLLKRGYSEAGANVMVWRNLEAK